MSDEQRPLLPSSTIPHLTPSNISRTRRQTGAFLTSKYGHYGVLALVSVDISAIFADLILQLLTCEGRIPYESGETASKVLGILSLVFSSLFMVELLASIWAFGWQ